mmetsp:Transcript_24837/g.76704  ORF Transcript_24837/g.76704 Transcript_24837/m.76704 type:complete len:169 (-) Transcript_24837:86-592(-)
MGIRADDNNNDPAEVAVRRALAELGPSLSRLGVRSELAPAIADTVRRVVRDALSKAGRPEVEEHLCQQLTSLENIVDEMTLARTDDDDDDDEPKEEESWRDRALKRYYGDKPRGGADSQRPPERARPPGTSQKSKVVVLEPQVTAAAPPRIIKGFTGRPKPQHRPSFR